MIKTTILPNGLTVATEEIPHANSLGMAVLVKCGSRLETEETSGICHFLEHMHFKGTEKRSVKELSSVLERRGGHLNAYTSKEHTNYYCNVVNTDYKLAVDVLADLFLHSVYDPAEIEKEKKVIIEEINLYEDSPDDCVLDMLGELFWGNHPLARPILGIEETVSSFTRDDLVTFRHKHYLPSETVLVAVGSLNHEAIVEEAVLRFSDYAEDANPKPLVVPQPQSGIITRTKQINQEHIALAVPGVSMFDEKDYYPSVVLTDALGGGPSSRLFQKIREDLALAYSVFAFETHYQDAGIIGIYAGTGKEKGEMAAEYCRKEMLELAKNGLSNDELEQKKTELCGSMLISQDSISNRLTRLGRRMLFFGNYRPIEETMAELKKVTVEDTQRVAAKTFKEENIAFALLGGE